jgi:hypothetical protein
MAEHPITPPPELVEQWAHLPADWNTVAHLIAQWGADMELEECLSYASDQGLSTSQMRNHRRPKPPNLKEQALAELAEWECVMDIAPDSPIRRALESLPDE